MDIIKNWLVVICVCFVIGLGAKWIISPKPEPIQTVTNIHDTIIIKGDSIPYPVYVTLSRPILNRVDTFWKSKPVDTAKLFNQFYSVYVQNDTISKDSNFVAIIIDTITQNTIIGRKFWHQNLRQTKETTKVIHITDPMPKLLLGGGIGLGNRIGLNITGTYLFNQELAVSGNLDPLNKYTSINLQYKFK